MLVIRDDDVVVCLCFIFLDRQRQTIKETYPGVSIFLIGTQTMSIRYSIVDEEIGNGY